MASSEERIKILQMIQDGKISADDGAKLLEALNKGARHPSFSRRPMSTGSSSRFLRVRVTDMDSGRSKVSVNLPLSLVDAGMSIASNFAPSVANADIVEAIESGLTGKVIDVFDEEDREHVEIYIE